MSSSDLPAWVYDVVIALVDWRDYHPKLYAEYLTKDGEFRKQPVADCGCKPLDHVPPAVVDKARTIRDYLAAKTETAPQTGPSATQSAETTPTDTPHREGT